MYSNVNKYQFKDKDVKQIFSSPSNMQGFSVLLENENVDNPQKYPSRQAIYPLIVLS